MAEFIQKGSKTICPNCIKSKVVNLPNKDSYCSNCGKILNFTTDKDSTVFKK